MHFNKLQNTELTVDEDFDSEDQTMDRTEQIVE